MGFKTLAFWKDRVAVGSRRPLLLFGQVGLRPDRYVQKTENITARGGASTLCPGVGRDSVSMA